jgi:hypothetical protein
MIQEMNTHAPFTFSENLQTWWDTFYVPHTQATFPITQRDYDRVCLLLNNIQYSLEPVVPHGLSPSDCTETLNIFCSLLPTTTPSQAKLLRSLARMRACLDNI